jgi:hypothetical protein
MRPPNPALAYGRTASPSAGEARHVLRQARIVIIHKQGDSAIKIGLGEVMGGVTTYLTTKLNHNSEIEKGRII